MVWLVIVLIMSSMVWLVIMWLHGMAGYNVASWCGWLLLCCLVWLVIMWPQDVVDHYVTMWLHCVAGHCGYTVTSQSVVGQYIGSMWPHGVESHNVGTV